MNGLVFAHLAQGPLPTEVGQFDIHVFSDGQEEAIVLKKGQIGGKSNVPCRIHSECICSHVFFGTICDCREQMLNAQRFIEKEGLGLIIFLHQEGRGNGTAAHIATLSLKTQGVAQGEAYKSVGFPPDVRRFDIAAKIIKFFGVDSVHLLSGNKEKRGCLKTWGIPIAKITPLFGNILWVREQIEANLTFRSRWH